MSTVAAFVEKPDRATAERYVSEGYLWNSGNFLFRADTMLEAFRTHAPDILRPVEAAIGAATQTDGTMLLDAARFAEARATSVDYAIMEKVSNIAVVAGRFPWSDIGSWDAVWQVLPRDEDGNAIVGEGHAIGARNTLIHSHGRFTVASGVEDLAVITTEDTVLVLPKAHSQEVKTIAAQIEKLKSAVPSSQRPSFPQPVASLDPKSLAFETMPLVKPTGFREYIRPLVVWPSRLAEGAGTEPHGSRGDRPRHRHAPAAPRPADDGGDRPRLPELFAVDQERHDQGP